MSESKDDSSGIWLVPQEIWDQVNKPKTLSECVLPMPEGGRVFVRVMDDGLQTKDGAA